MDEVEELSWKMLDNHISDTDLQRLEKLLQNDADSRQRYLDCVKLHCELNAFFRPASRNPESSLRSTPTGMLPQNLSASSSNSLQR
ncbi:hypothetical protein RMSM_04897 [Rhodopirellula maiorica SM1]|uniref:Uncharacterized protein n=2 Tax=Novipirellula TaxID=2795426 RepID=M5RFM9_9BACT|nr:hypothetical protein RMSM_04897 [Rhodopirellula maiorica SM1]